MAVKEVRGQMSDVRCQMSDVESVSAQITFQMSVVRCPWSVVQQTAMKQLDRKQLVDFHRVVAQPTDVRLHQPLQSRSVNVRPGAGTRVQQNFLHITGELMTIPSAEMTEFLATQKKSLKPEWRETFVNSRQPVGHPVVVGVFGFGQKFLNRAMHAVCYSIRRVSDAAISRNAAKQQDCLQQSGAEKAQDSWPLQAAPEMQGRPGRYPEKESGH